MKDLKEPIIYITFSILFVVFIELVLWMTDAYCSYIGHSPIVTFKEYLIDQAKFFLYCFKNIA